jgi:hypothetical protein
MRISRRAGQANAQWAVFREQLISKFPARLVLEIDIRGRPVRCDHARQNRRVVARKYALPPLALILLLRIEGQGR